MNLPSLTVGVRDLIGCLASLALVTATTAMLPVCEPTWSVMTETPVANTPDNRHRPIASVVLAAVSIGLVVVVEVATLASRNWLTRSIDEFQMDVSEITRIAIDPTFPFLLFWIILAAICTQFVPVSQWVMDICNAVVILIGTSCLVIYLLGILAPLIRLVYHLS